MGRKKNNSDGSLYVVYALALVFFLIFLINSVMVYRHWDRKFDFARASARVTDAWNFLRFVPAFIALGFLDAIFMGGVAALSREAPPNAAALAMGSCAMLLLGLIAFFPSLLLSSRLGTTQAGLLIYKSRDFFVAPTDWNKNTFSENIFGLQIISAMYSMESLRLSEIWKITRQGEKIAFVHGAFGTRRLAWRNRQKRDECIAALEMACGRRLGAHI